MHTHTVTRGLRPLAFYGATSLLLLAIVTKQLDTVLPHGLATQIGHNSESLTFALLVCATIQYVRPAALRSPHPWRLPLAVFAGCMVLAVALLELPVPGSLHTLNEPVLAAGVLALYVQLRRPLWFAPLLSLGVLAVVVLLYDTQFVLDQLESLVPLMLAPIGLDVLDRSLLDRRHPDTPRSRLVWCAILVAIGLGAMLLAPGAREDLSGSLNLGIDYAHRASESYWGLLLVHGYFSYWLASRWRSRPMTVAPRIAVPPVAGKPPVAGSGLPTGESGDARHA